MPASRRLVLVGGLAAAGCSSLAVTAGGVRRMDPALDGVVAPDARLERLASGFTWSEGPVWIAEGAYLLFSDVPENRIHRWSRAGGLSVFMAPSGYDGPDPSVFREPGSNGLIAGPAGTILMADHGNRAIARVDLATQVKTLLATHYRGARFNSPNDLVQASNGAIFFTDPPYGLKDMDRSPLKEMAENGFYRLDPDGGVHRLVDDLTFPNGVALSPDQRTLYVSVSDPARPVLMAYELDGAGGIRGGRVFKDFAALAGPSAPGLPDGMAVDRDGRLFATGPGGVHVLTPDGRSLGLIDTAGAAANCTFGEDGRTLFITAGDRLLRLETLTRG